MASQDREESRQIQDSGENGNGSGVSVNRETQKIMGALLKRRREARTSGSVSGADSSAILRQWRSESKVRRSS